MHTYDDFLIQREVKKFLEDKEVYCAPKTVEYYRNALHVFQNFLREKEIEDLDMLDEDELKSFVLWLRKKEVKSISIHTYMRAVKNFCSWGIINQTIDPFNYKIKLPRPAQDVFLPLTEDEVQRILEYLSKCGKDKQVFFRLMLDCGLRSQEALNLKREDIDFDKKILYIRESKYDKSRLLPIPDRVLCLLDPDQEGKIFSFGESGKNCLFRRIKDRCDINRIHAHLLRHTFATSYMMKRGNLEYLRMYMGHSSYNVTQDYIKSAFQCDLTHYDIYKIDDIFK